MRAPRVTDQAVAVGAVVVSLFLGLASAEARAGTVMRSGMALRDEFDTERRPLKYYVLQVMGVSGQVTFEVVADIEYAQRRKDYKEEHEKAVVDWRKAKADAKRKKEEYKEEMPKGPVLMVKREQSFKKEQDARAEAEKLQKKWDEAMEKKLAKKEGAGKEVTTKREEKKE